MKLKRKSKKTSLNEICPLQKKTSLFCLLFTACNFVARASHVRCIKTDYFKQQFRPINLYEDIMGRNLLNLLLLSTNTISKPSFKRNKRKVHSLLHAIFL